MALSQTEISYIVTHGGKAHADEYLGICMLLNILGGQTPVYRRDPTEDELKDPAVLVIDVGGSHDPSLNNYDHHQDRNLSCAMRLVAQELGVDEALMRVYPGYETVNQLDLHGSRYAEEELGVSSEELRKLENPLTLATLGAFSRQSPAVDPRITASMELIGQEMATWIKEYQAVYERISRLPIQEVEGIKYIVDFEQFDGHSAHNDFAAERGISVVVSRSRSDMGQRYERMNDDPRLDFQQLKGGVDVEFTHNRGFFATTNTPFVNPEEFIRASIVREAVVNPAQVSVAASTAPGTEIREAAP